MKKKWENEMNVNEKWMVKISFEYEDKLIKGTWKFRNALTDV